MRVNRKFDSNEIDERDLQRVKRREARISTLLGMKSDLRNNLSGSSDSIHVNVEFDFNVICKMLTILDQEPEHCLKMPPIPFVSMMQLIRM
jgi:hypothetical protein